jgi:type IV secretion system protein VirB11
LTIDVVAHMEAYAVYNEEGEQTARRWGMTEVWFDPVRKTRTTFA